MIPSISSLLGFKEASNMANNERLDHKTPINNLETLLLLICGEAKEVSEHSEAVRLLSMQPEKPITFESELLIVALISEMLDTVGYIEVVARNADVRAALGPSECGLLAESILRAVDLHQTKCKRRGLPPLNDVYALFTLLSKRVRAASDGRTDSPTGWAAL